MVVRSADRIFGGGGGRGGGAATTGGAVVLGQAPKIVKRNNVTKSFVDREISHVDSAKVDAWRLSVAQSKL
jgi:hypothetical protein